MDVQAVNRLREELNAMTHWIQKEPNVTRYFPSNYESPSQSYIDRMKSSN